MSMSSKKQKIIETGLVVNFELNSVDFVVSFGTGLRDRIKIFFSDAIIISNIFILFY